MAREVDKRKTQKALRRLKRAAERAEAGEGAQPLSDWEKEFVAGVSQRLETYGSAFRDPGKGRLEEALSNRQSHVARVIEKKTRPKLKPAAAPEARPEPPRRSSFKRKPPASKARVRDIHDDLADPEPPAPAAPPRGRALKVIEGGRSPAKPGSRR